MKTLRISALQVGAFLALAVVGCSADSGDTAVDDTESTEQGLTLFTADPVAGLSGMYEAKGMQIWFETVRGPDYPAEHRAMVPNTPEYPVDLRIRDKSGTITYQQSGELMDQQWVADEERELAIPLRPEQVELRIESGTLLPHFAAALAQAEIPEAVRLEASSLIQVAKNTAESAASPELPTSLSPTNITAGSGPYNHTVRIYRCTASSAGLPLIMADHSSVTAEVRTTTGSLIRSGYTCNHGPCAPTGMSFKCSDTRYGESSSSFTLQNCSTDYGVTTREIHHVCNDDTEMQYHNVMYNTTYSTGINGGPHGSCGLYGFNPYSPSCSH